MSHRRGHTGARSARREQVCTRTLPRGGVAALAGILVVGALAAGSAHVRPTATAPAVRAALESAPPLAVAATVAILSLFLVPRAPLAAIVGLLLGPVVGTLAAMVGLVLGAVAAFGLGRLLGEPVLTRLLRDRPGLGRIARLQRWVVGHELLAVVYARLLPFVPFALVNYTFGATRVRLGVFAVGTAIGILPSTALYATAGATARELRSATFGTSALLSVGLLVVTAVTHLLVTRR